MYFPIVSDIQPTLAERMRRSSKDVADLAKSTVPKASAVVVARQPKVMALLASVKATHSQHEPVFGLELRAIRAHAGKARFRDTVYIVIFVKRVAVIVYARPQRAFDIAGSEVVDVAVNGHFVTSL